MKKASHFIKVFATIIALSILIPVSTFAAEDQPISDTADEATAESSENPPDTAAQAVLIGEKHYELTLDKEYERVEFSVVPQKEGNYTVSLQVPSSKEEIILGMTSDGRTQKTVLTKPNPGIYTVNVLLYGDASLAGSDVNDLIGEVTIKARSLKADEVSVSAYVPVAKEISGLHMFFYDREFNVTWSDTNVGPVNIIVSDARTNKVIGQDTVREMIYKVDIPDNIDRITVQIVPSSSQNIDGAGARYSFDVIDEVNATITCELDEYINYTPITITTMLNQPYTVQIKVNNVAVTEETDFMEAGEYTFKADLDEGNNNIEVCLKDENGNIKTVPFTTMLDTISPTLTIERDINGIQTYDSVIQIAGIVSNYKEITLNNDVIEPDWEGKFVFDINLSEGENHIVVKAVDEAGNESVYDSYVSRIIKTEREIPIEMITYIAAGAICVILLIIALIRKKRRGTPTAVTGTVNTARKGKVLSPASKKKASSNNAQEYKIKKIVTPDGKVKLVKVVPKKKG